MTALEPAPAAAARRKPGPPRGWKQHGRRSPTYRATTVIRASRFEALRDALGLPDDVLASVIGHFEPNVTAEQAQRLVTAILTGHVRTPYAAAVLARFIAQVKTETGIVLVAATPGLLRAPWPVDLSPPALERAT